MEMAWKKFILPLPCFLLIACNANPLDRNVEEREWGAAANNWHVETIRVEEENLDTSSEQAQNMYESLGIDLTTKDDEVILKNIYKFEETCQDRPIKQTVLFTSNKVLGAYLQVGNGDQIEMMEKEDFLKEHCKENS